MPLAWLVVAIFVLFGGYAIAPIFGLDELYPQFFHDDAFLWQAGIVAIVLIGAGIWWQGRDKDKEQD